MNKNISMVFTFVAGIAVGAAAAYKVAEQKYSNIANDEIESVIERFSNRPSTNVQEAAGAKDVVEVDDTKVIKSKSSIVEYKETVDRFGYDKISEEQNKPKKNTRKKKAVVEIVEQEKNSNPSIYIITPDEFNTLEDYSSATLYYSSDNYLLDSDCRVMSELDIKNTIDHDPYGHFGEYEEDSVYVRNENLMCDYEILLSQRTRNEIMEA